MSKSTHRAIAKVYAEGLARALGQDSAKMESAWRELDQLWRFAMEHKDFEAFMNSPRVPRGGKHALLDNLFAVCEASAEVKSFCKLLLKSGRFLLFCQILEVLEELVLKSQGRVKALVTSATGLLPEEIEALKTNLEARLNQKLQMTFREDRNLIGGVVVRVEDEIFDGSIQKQLENLKIKLCEWCEV